MQQRNVEEEIQVKRGTKKELFNRKLKELVKETKRKVEEKFV